MDTATCRSQQDDHSLHTDGYCILHTSDREAFLANRWILQPAGFSKEASRGEESLYCIDVYSMFEGNGRVMDPIASLRLIEMWETLALHSITCNTQHMYTVINRE